MATAVSIVEPPQRSSKMFVKVMSQRYNVLSAPHFRSTKPSPTTSNLKQKQEQKQKARADKKAVHKSSSSGNAKSDIKKKGQQNRGKKKGAAQIQIADLSSDGMRHNHILPLGQSAPTGRVVSSGTQQLHAVAADPKSKVGKIWSRVREHDLAINEKMSVEMSGSTVEETCNEPTTSPLTGARSQPQNINRSDSQGHRVTVAQKPTKGSTLSSNKHLVSKKNDWEDTREQAKVGSHNNAACIKDHQDTRCSKGSSAAQKESPDRKTSSSSSSSSKQTDVVSKTSSRTINEISKSTKKKDSHHDQRVKTKKECNLPLHVGDRNSPKSKRRQSRRRGRSLPKLSLRKAAITKEGKHIGHDKRARRGRSLPKVRFRKKAAKVQKEDRHGSDTKSPKSQSSSHRDKRAPVQRPTRHRGRSLPKPSLRKVAKNSRGGKCDATTSRKRGKSAPPRRRPKLSLRRKVVKVPREERHGNDGSSLSKSQSSSHRGEQECAHHPTRRRGRSLPKLSIGGVKIRRRGDRGTTTTARKRGESAPASQRSCHNHQVRQNTESRHRVRRNPLASMMHRTSPPPRDMPGEVALSPVLYTDDGGKYGKKRPGSSSSKYCGVKRLSAASGKVKGTELSEKLPQKKEERNKRHGVEDRSQRSSSRGRSPELHPARRSRSLSPSKKHNNEDIINGREGSRRSKSLSHRSGRPTALPSANSTTLSMHRLAKPALTQALVSKSVNVDYSLQVVDAVHASSDSGSDQIIVSQQLTQSSVKETADIISKQSTSEVNSDVEHKSNKNIDEQPRASSTDGIQCATRNESLKKMDIIAGSTKQKSNRNGDDSQLQVDLVTNTGDSEDKITAIVPRDAARNDISGSGGVVALREEEDRSKTSSMSSRVNSCGNPRPIDLASLPPDAPPALLTNRTDSHSNGHSTVRGFTGEVVKTFGADHNRDSRVHDKQNIKRSSRGSAKRLERSYSGSHSDKSDNELKPSKSDTAIVISKIDNAAISVTKTDKRSISLGTKNGSDKSSEAHGISNKSSISSKRSATSSYKRGGRRNTPSASWQRKAKYTKDKLLRSRTRIRSSRSSIGKENCSKIDNGGRSEIADGGSFEKKEIGSSEDSMYGGVGDAIIMRGGGKRNTHRTGSSTKRPQRKRIGSEFHVSPRSITGEARNQRPWQIYAKKAFGSNIKKGISLQWQLNAKLGGRPGASSKQSTFSSGKIDGSNSGSNSTRSTIKSSSGIKSSSMNGEIGNKGVRFTNAKSVRKGNLSKQISKLINKTETPETRVHTIPSANGEVTWVFE